MLGVYPLDASFACSARRGARQTSRRILTFDVAESTSRGMSNESHIILRLRAEANKKRSAALERAEKSQREAERFGFEIEAYDKAIKAMERAGITEALEDVGIDLDLKPKPKAGASEKWVSIYKALHDAADAPYSYEDLSTAVDLAGHSASSGSQRTQMMNAVKAGWFDRVGHGKFKFTESGLALIGADPNDNSGTAEPEEAKAESAGGTFGFHNPNFDRPGQ